MASSNFISDLAFALEQKLPGWEAQKEMIPEGREAFPVSLDLRKAAVLIALFQDEDEWVFPLIKRSADGFAHSGQIALPGGRQEGNENNIQTALREAWEEVNIDTTQVQVLGKLSPLPIPVSRHMVHPIIGSLDAPPDLVPDPREVQEIFTVSVKELRLNEIQFEMRRFRERDWNIPYLEVQGHKVWGATAMILSEFRAILAKVP